MTVEYISPDSQAHECFVPEEAIEMSLFYDFLYPVNKDKRN